ncbi:MAG: DNA-binding NtrC family response regulator [Crocinitomix sp.]|jgi:DNA-binding NtrC family response regulator
MKTFIIDDDELFTQSLSKYLEGKSPGATYQFHKLSAALGKLDLAPEVIILDHLLQGTFGIDLIPIIKEKLPRTKIIYVSAQTDVNVLATARMIGATHYIKKDKYLFENIVNEINKKTVHNQSKADNVFYKLKSLVKKPRKKTLFIVDDDELYSVFLRYKLSKSQDFDIFMYKDGQSVIEDISKAPDVLILDYKLVKMTAEVVLKEFKKRSPRTQVIILSSQENIDVALNLFEMGIEDYVVKNKDWEGNLLYAIDKFTQHRTKANLKYV